MDGVDQLNNILVIGMTNRRDMIDEALLRPGRMEIQMEISLPDEHGRVQILNIHTAKMREQKSMGADVDVKELATLTKNFSGAEIEGLVRAAQSSAMNRLVKVGQKVRWPGTTGMQSTSRSAPVQFGPLLFAQDRLVCDCTRCVA